MKRGQVTLATALVSATAVVLASAFTAWATASGSIAEVSQQVSIVEERENNHYAEVIKRLDRFEAKLDAALKP